MVTVTAAAAWVTTVAVWIGSHGVERFASMACAGYLATAGWADGRLWVLVMDPVARRDVGDWQVDGFDETPGWLVWFVCRNCRPMLGVRWGAYAEFEMFQAGSMSVRTWAVEVPPLWPLTLASLSLGMAFWNLRRSRPVADCCPGCGYDLRATPARCPECGRARSDG